MVWHCQNLFNLAITATAEVNLMQISAEQVPSLHRVAPKYLKLVTSPHFRPFMVIYALMYCSKCSMAIIKEAAVGNRQTCKGFVHSFLLITAHEMCVLSSI